MEMEEKKKSTGGNKSKTGEIKKNVGGGDKHKKGTRDKQLKNREISGEDSRKMSAKMKDSGCVGKEKTSEKDRGLRAR